MAVLLQELFMEDGELEQILAFDNEAFELWDAPTGIRSALLKTLGPVRERTGNATWCVPP